MKTPLLFLFASCLLSASLYAQEPIMQTEAVADPAELIEEFLLGSGVLIDNVSQSGYPQQVAAFSNGLLEAGINEGVVMATDVVVPFANFLNTVPFGEGLQEDQDLLAIANLVPELIGAQFSIPAVYDVSMLEFDFIPYGDSIAFNYSFASDEYLGWENTSFNDVFAFFLSGPGIEGPYSAPEAFPGGAINIAYVPGSDPELPITVSSVHLNLNGEFFVPSTEFNVPFNGRTVPFTASYGGLQIGETYHIRLAIADGSDTALPSFVFLEAGSFTSNQEVDEDSSIADLNGDGILNVEDLLLIIGQFGCEGECSGDFDNSGAVDVGDILFFLGLFD